MSENSNSVIGNASEIIERFGGIRPMSTKTGIPVTTIQGWKQRNAIPANRRNELIDAANQHGIMLGRLLIDIAGEKIEELSVGEEKILQKEKIEASLLDPELRPASNTATLIAATSLILVAALAGTIFAVAPKFSKVTEQDSRIRELEQQIAAMQNAKNTVLEERQAAQIKATIDNLEGKVGALADQAKSVAGVVDDLKEGTIPQRLSKIESRVGGLLEQTSSFSLQGIVGKFQNLQSTPEGQGQIQGLMSTFTTATENMSATEDISLTFAKLKETNPHVAETFKDVAPEDMKAAVMLLGMTQLRESLARDNASFDQDLQILKSTVDKDNVELLAALDRLAPRAKMGILTPSGLSKELRGLTGDIVSASLTGQDVSVEDRVLARFGDVLKVEKNGQLISGTQTQMTIDAAQKKLDSGDVAGAVVLLQQIQGPAAEKTKPILESAQATLFAGQLKNMLGSNITQTLRNVTGKSSPYTNNGGMGQILDNVKSMGDGLSGGL
jgi:hypothetical protein